MLDNLGLFGRFHRLGGTGLVLSIMVFCLAPVTEIQATTIYSYIDEHGNPVYTDAPETIPEKYRAKVKTHERVDRTAAGPAETPKKETAQQAMKAQVKDVWTKLLSHRVTVEGLSSGQLDILNYAGAAALVLLIIMFLSKKRPMLRLLCFSLLILLGIGTPVMMYVGEGGTVEVLKKKAIAAGQDQEDRLQQVPR